MLDNPFEGIEDDFEFLLKKNLVPPALASRDVEIKRAGTCCDVNGEDKKAEEGRT